MTSRGAALVTGAGRRIGQVLALEAARAGYDVAIHYRASGDEAEDTARAVRDLGRRALLVRADLSDEDETRSLVAQAAPLGPLTLLINNASAFEDDRVGGLSRAAWDRHLETNLRAPIVLAEAMAAALPDDRHGLVVNLIDQRVWRPNPQFFSYTLSKAGLWWATQTLAQALAPRIRVNAIAPAVTMVSGPQSRENFNKAHTHNPLGRGVQVEEIVAALRFIVATPTLHGQTITLDAGQRLMGMPRDVAFMVGDE